MRARVLRGLMAVALGTGLAQTVAAQDLSLWVSPDAPFGADSSCADAGYASVQAAVDAAPDGATINVCPGVYDERVVLAANPWSEGYRPVRDLTLRGTVPGAAVLRPTQPDALNDYGQVVVVLSRDSPGSDRFNSSDPVLHVPEDVGQTTIRDLVLDGGGSRGVASTGVYVRAEIYSGASAQTVLLQGLAIHDVLDGVVVDNTLNTLNPPKLATVSLTKSTISGYTRFGVRCAKPGVSCTVRGNHIIGSGAEAGVVVEQSARGAATGNTISGNTTGEYATGVLLSAAGFVLVNEATRQTVLRTSTVSTNTLVDNHAGVRLYQSSATISGNLITVPAGGSFGVFGLGLASGNRTLLTRSPFCGGYVCFATTEQPVVVTGNTILFQNDLDTIGIGISMGDTDTIGGGMPAWSQKVTESDNIIVNADTPVLLGDAAVVAP